ncbi:MAG TPA: glycosyltransferase family 4 protein [Vicinamibacterales bacterium]|nr:glycosyltransferase family 4 protein [Vicinamibacterales bacterium]
MNLLYLTAGAAEMYCGSCLRDNALAAALMARGHKVMLTPIYTPTTTDEANVSSPHVLFGGVSVFLEQHVPLFRHTPAWLDRLWDSTPILKLASKRQIKVDPRVLGEMTVSMLKGADGHQRKEIDKMVRWLRNEPRFDAVTIPFTLLIGLARPLKRALGIPVTCTLQGEDLFLENLQEPWKSESLALIRRAIDDVDLYIAVSDYYRDFMTGYLGIRADRIRTVPLGITMDGHAPRPPRSSPPYTIGFFARIAPEKGLHLLIEAYRQLRAMPGVPETRLVAGGYLLDEHRDYLAGIERQMRQWDLGDHFRYAGAPDRAGKIALLRSFDVLSVPSVYREPKGLFLLEAMANGVPVVQPDHGAFREVIERTGGGVLVPPGDAAALAGALRDLLIDRQRAQDLADAGVRGVRGRYTVQHMAEAAEAAYQGLLHPEHPTAPTQ